MSRHSRELRHAKASWGCKDCEVFLLLLVFTLSAILGLCAATHAEYVVVDMSQPHDVIGYKSVQIRQGVAHFCNPFDENRGKMSLLFGD